jgi:SAM-dependent methyltransferase
MSNKDVYAAGLLNRALDPATQPPEIREFLQAEIDLLDETVVHGMSIIDIGCGTGRHLAMLRDRVRIGVGIDYERAYLLDARSRQTVDRLLFVAADAARLPLAPRFDLAICMTNSWGTMENKRGVLDEMRRCVPREGMRLISVFAAASVPARREWYQRLGHAIAVESPEFLMTDGGLRSEHFTEARLRALVGDCAIHRCTNMGYVVRF